MGIISHHRLVFPYGVAVLAPLLALLLRLLLAPWLGTAAPLLVFVAAVMLSGWYGGLRVGLLSTVLSTLLAAFFLLPPTFSLAIANSTDNLQLVLFLMIGALISVLNGALKRSQQRITAMAASLKESEERYRLMVDSVQDYAIFMLDRDGKIISWNTGAERIKGYQTHEILGQPFSILFLKGDVERHQPEYEMQIAAAEGRFHGEGWRRRKDGSRFWADAVLTAVRDETGKLRGFCKVTRDMTEYRQAEAAIAAHEIRFRRLAESNLIGIIQANIDGRITNANDAFLQMVGYTQDDLQAGRVNWQQMTPVEFQPQTQQAMNHLRQEGSSFSYEKEYIRRDGSRVPVLVATIMNDRSVDNFIGLVVNLSERKQSEQALQQSYNLLQSVIEGTTDAMFMKDRWGYYRLLNSATARVFGSTKAEILGKGDQHFLPPDQATALQAIDHTIMETGVSHTLEEQLTDLATGEVRTFLTTKDPYRNADGNIIGVVGIARDITDRKQAEEFLRRSTQRLEALQAIDRAILGAASTQDIARAALSRLIQVVRYHQAAVILFNFETNEAQLLAGKVDGEFAGETLPIADLMPLDFVKQREPVRYIEDIGTMLHRPPLLERLFAEGIRSFLSVALVVEGKLIGDLSLFAIAPSAFDAERREISQEIANQLAIAIQQAHLREELQHYAAELEQRVAERTAELRDANDALQAFAYSASHDLRAPLRAMEGLAQALLEDYTEQLGEIGQQYVHRIVSAAQDMTALIQNLLNYSRLSRADIALTPVDLNFVMTTVLAQLRETLGLEQLHVTVQDSLPVVIAHLPILEQIIMNLLTNAIKFVPPGIAPKIHIWAEERQEDSEMSNEEQTSQHENKAQLSIPPSQFWLRLWIEDNGIGIPPEQQERIFHVFERLHGADHYSGTGIGLAIVQKGVERMGGRVGVESQVGQGSRFWIELPKVADIDSIQ
jgi:PAS domain S-box-containing protein